MTVGTSSCSATWTDAERTFSPPKSTRLATSKRDERLVVEVLVAEVALGCEDTDDGELPVEHAHGASQRRLAREQALGRALAEHHDLPAEPVVLGREQPPSRAAR